MNATATTTYPVFENNQVLTSSQLNQLITYLDQQERLTRAKLIGMGIVCGLEVGYASTPASGGSPESAININISKGAGLTSEGFLLSLSNCETKYFRPYTLPPGSRYAPFEDPATGDQDVGLFEIITKRSTPANTEEKLLESFDDEATNVLADYAVLLFLEIFDKDLKSCLGKSCDDIGIDRIFTLRKLLISKTDLTNKVLTRSANVDGLFPEKYDLPRLVLPKPLFDPAALPSTDYTEFSKHYVAAFSPLYDELFLALNSTYDIYEPILAPVYQNNNPFISAAVAGLKNTWAAFFGGTASPGPAYQGIQYFYDFVKDLVLAYNEFRQVAFDLMSQCCPDMSLFPRHLMLGEVRPAADACRPSPYRHGFTQPPIYNRQQYLLEKTLMLHKRIVLQLESFDLNIINNPAANQAIRITPSQEKRSGLGRRAVPYYYDLAKLPAVAALGTLEKNWNYDLSRRCPGNGGFTLAYRNQSASQESRLDPIRTPLFYDTDAYPFFRIEGQIGQDYTLALSQLETLIQSKNLPFRIQALKLDPALQELSINHYCGFEDLQEEYLLLRDTWLDFRNNFEKAVKLLESNPDQWEGIGDLTNAEVLDRLNRILTFQNDLQAELTPCLPDLQFASFQQRYKTLIQAVIDFLLVDLEGLDRIGFDQGDGPEEVAFIHQSMNIGSLYFYDLFDLLLYKKMLRLYHAFRRREHYLRLRQQPVFSRLLQKHPGAEHQAGVYKGGTFILLYLNAANPKVIGDFSLPYLCCGEDLCIPMCDDPEDPGLVQLPPLARPDYAVTLVNVPLDIIVLDNDAAFLNGNLAISGHDERSEQGGSLGLGESQQAITYAPPRDFTGFDRFNYAIVNRDTGQEDTGRVTVLVKRAQARQGCYSADILRCWGEEFVDFGISIRELGPDTLPFDQKIDLLLRSLQETRGFTEQEIFGSILEAGQARIQLLKCLGIDHNPEDYQGMGELILDYQKNNCGAIFNNQVTGRITAQSGEFLSGVRIQLRGTNLGAITDAAGNYTFNVPDGNGTLVFTLPGFRTQTTAIRSRPVINVVMVQEQIP